MSVRVPRQPAPPAVLPCNTPVRALLLLAAAALTGCQGLSPASQSIGTSIHGLVHGGQNPVSGASIQLYAAGTTGDASAATPLLNNPVTTDQNGKFIITADYTCPAANPPVYLVATGGNPGLTTGTNNAALSLMATLGPCSTLSSSTFIQMNEVTTIGSIAALYPFMSSYAYVGAGTSDAAQLSAAFTLATEYVDYTTGSAPGPNLPANYYASTAEINTLANVVSSCVNSFGGTASDGSACGSLLSLTTPTSASAPTNTIGAVINVLKYPLPVPATSLYALAPGTGAPFQPALAASPANWSLPIIPMAVTPAFIPAAGTYAGPQVVSITEGTSGALLYVTTDGSTPTTASTLYTSPITISSSQTIKALAVLGTSSANSASASAAYTITAATAATAPTFSPAAGAYTATQSVTLSTPTPGATIYYTTDGSTPTTASTLYTAPIAVSSSQTIKAIATASPLLNSPVASAAYSLTSYGIISTYAGNGTYGYTGDGGQAISAEINTPWGVVTDPAGNLYIADADNNVIRKVTPAGVISTFAGLGTFTYSGDGGLATAAGIYGPNGLAMDSSGNLYLADDGNNRVRKITPQGIISTIAGNGTAGYAGDGAQATSAELNVPIAVAADPSGNIYIADRNNNVIRKVTPAGVISTYAGTGSCGFSGDGGPAASAQICNPYGVAVDTLGNLYLADTSNAVIRKVTPAGIISTVAGSYPGTGVPSGDGGLATSANFSSSTTGVAVDSQNNLYIADFFGQNIRKVNSSGIISTVAGNGTSGFTGDGYQATAAELNHPISLAVDSTGNLYIADQYNQRIRKVTFEVTPPPAPTPYFTLGGSTNFYGGTFGATQYLGIYVTYTTGATIYYTTDGSTPTTTSTSCTNSCFLTVASTQTIKAIAIEPGESQSAVATAYLSIVPVPPPTFSPAGGSYSGTQTVTLSAASGNIWYTTDGSTPVQLLSTQYTAPITVSSSQTIKAIAISGSGYTTQAQSTVATAVYSIVPAAPTPTFFYGNGLYGAPFTEYITTPGISGATIYYTTDNSTPTTSSAVYNNTTGLTVSQGGVIKAIATATGYSTSAVGSVSINYLALAAPQFSVPGGSYSTTQTVYLGASSGTTIYYTTNGTTPTSSSTQYTSGPITVSSTETIQAIAVAGSSSGYVYTGSYPSSPVASASYTITAPAATPTFSLAPGTYTSVQTVYLYDANPGTIYYTTNGTTPTTASAVYNPSTGITVSATETIQAIATATGYSTSGVGSVTYTLNLPAASLPYFGVVGTANSGGEYATPQSLTIYSSTPGASIYYTTNYTTPTTASTLYTGAITVSTSEGIEAIAIAPGYSQSATASTSVSILPVYPPSFYPAAGTYTSTQTVYLNSSTNGATIYYTTNGTTPTTASTSCTFCSITVSSTQTINAIAVAGYSSGYSYSSGGYPSSAVASATYTITP